MKRLLLTALLALCVATSNFAVAQHPSEVQFTFLEDETTEGKFYPSLAIWNSHQDDPTDLFYSFSLNAPKAGSVIRITIEETPLNEETIIQETADSRGEMVISPIIKWNYEKLSKLSQGGTVTLTCILEIDGKEIDRLNQVIPYRSVNECVFGFVDGDQWLDTSEMFALYVNEDYPKIDGILEEILAVDRSRQFIDYQGEFEDVLNQMFWVWEYFSQRGTRYSNIVNTTNVSEYMGIQYVRFIDQVIGNNQANCVDGSAMLASIYRKIGLEACLIVLPTHCQLAIYYPGEADIDGDGEIDCSECFLLMETTLMGNVADPEESFVEAITGFDPDGLQSYLDEEGGVIISISDARSAGIPSISRK